MYNIDTVKKRSLKGADKMKKIPGVDMEKAADLEILAEKLVMVDVYKRQVWSWAKLSNSIMLPVQR